MERRSPEGVDVGVRGGLGERDLARGRPGGERRRHLAGPGGDPRADVGQAGAALAGPEAGLAGALEQLELREALVPGGLEVGDGRAHARADDALGRRRRERRVLGRGADHAQRHLAGHPGEHVAGRAAEAEDHGVGRRRRLVAESSSTVTTARTRPSSPSNRTSRPGTVVAATPVGGVPTATASPSDTPAACSRSAARAVTRPRNPLPGHDRVDLGRPGRDDDLVGVDVEHPGRCAHDEHRAGVDRRRPRRPRRHRAPARLARPLRGLGRLASGRPAADDRDVDLAARDLDPARERRRRGGRGANDRQRRQPLGRMRHDRQPGPRRGLARPDVRDAVDLGEAVPAVAGQAERPAAPGRRALAEHRDRDGVAGPKGDRPPIDDEPPAIDGGRCRRSIGHWRIRVPAGSNSGSGWSRAGRRRPMISISKPLAARAVGRRELRRHVAQRDRLPARDGRSRPT